MEPQKMLPTPTPDTAPYWEGAGNNELRIQRCRECAEAYFYPRPYCPSCGGGEVEWFVASGRGTLYSCIINYRPGVGYTEPCIVAIVQLEEGPRMLSNIVNVDPDPKLLILDMPLTVAFERRGEISIPVFEPEGSR